MDKINLLVNLPAPFYRAPLLRKQFARLTPIAHVRRRSFNTAQEIVRDLAWADAVLMWSWPRLTPELLDQASKLKFAAHLDITQSAARTALERGLKVSQGRSAWSPAVAEMALALILSTLRRLSHYHAEMRAGKERWVKEFPTDIDPLERQLTGRSVGIVGLGRIGSRLAELLEPFGCPLRVCDPFVSQEMLDRFKARRVSIDEVCRQSEIVVLCAASNESSKHLVGVKQFRLLPKDALFVNVARAALVDTDALVARLRKNDLFAAIDVFDVEPTAKNHPLRKLPNAFLTPHRAGGVMESVERILRLLIDDLENHLTGRELKNPLVPGMIGSLDA